MKNKFFKMKNNRFKIIATFVMLLLIGYACEKELRDSLEEQKNFRAIERAG